MAETYDPEQAFGDHWQDEVCEDCGLGDMAEYTCPDQPEFCLNCCQCPEHIVDEHNPNWRD